MCICKWGALAWACRVWRPETDVGFFPQLLLPFLILRQGLLLNLELIILTSLVSHEPHVAGVICFLPLNPGHPGLTQQASYPLRHLYSFLTWLLQFSFSLVQSVYQMLNK